MTSEDLEALEKLEKAATPGPWRWRQGSVFPADSGTWVLGDGHEDDAGFVTALRNAAPALIAAARALNKACEDREKAEKWWADLHGISIDARHKLAAENARLRAVVEAARVLVTRKANPDSPAWLDEDAADAVVKALSDLDAKGVE